MPDSAFFRNLYAKCKTHGTAMAYVGLTDGELYALLSIAISDLKWSHADFDFHNLDATNQHYFNIPLSWFDQQGENQITQIEVERVLRQAFEKDNDFALYIENLTALHRKRVKYKRILAAQPMPSMDHIGPRALLEHGFCEPPLLANWMVWRKWIYDVDNRAAQETGYLFESILASCLGGESIGSRNSPVRRLDLNGEPTAGGRQIDCLVTGGNKAYEVKLRVTSAASGQGRFTEELSFPIECRAAGFTPVLLVLDPTPSNRLGELAEQYRRCEGEVFIGDDAWSHMTEEAGDVMSIFIKNYIKPAIVSIKNVQISFPSSVNLRWSENEIKISDDSASYAVNRRMKIADLNIEQFRQRLVEFADEYVNDWNSWLNTQPAKRAQQLGVILRRWQACRPNSMRRTRAENRHAEPYLEDLIEEAAPHIQTLEDFDIRTHDAFTPENCRALIGLWQIFEHLSYQGAARNGLAGVVGISKAVLLLTDGRVGPAFDSQVRRNLRIDEIACADRWIEALMQVSSDIQQFENKNQTHLRRAAPGQYSNLHNGRIYDMVLGPRG